MLLEALFAFTYQSKTKAVTVCLCLYSHVGDDLACAVAHVQFMTLVGVWCIAGACQAYAACKRLTMLALCGLFLQAARFRRRRLWLPWRS